jgi:DNA-binding NtrC family response regulator
VVLSPRPTIGVDALPPHVVENRLPRTEHDSVDAPDTPWEPTPLAEALMAPERRILLKALRANDWNRQRTADDLGINRTTLYKKMKAHGLDRMAG